MNKNPTKQLQEFAKLWGGFRASRVVLTANNYRIFDHLKAPKIAGDIARVIGADPRATEILLDAVTAVGLLKKTGGKYRNTEMAKKFLVKDSPLYQGDMLRHADSLWKSWSGLDEVVKTGLPNRSGGRDYDSFIRAMHNNAVFRIVRDEARQLIWHDVLVGFSLLNEIQAHVLDTRFYHRGYVITVAFPSPILKCHC